MSVILRPATSVAEITSRPRALAAFTRSILSAYLEGLAEEVVTGVRGGRRGMQLHMLGALYREDAGQHGDSFEWAVHEAIAHGEWGMTQYVQEALSALGLPCHRPTSILFGAERSRHLGFLEAVEEQAGPQAIIRVATGGRPPVLMRHLKIAAAGERRAHELPPSIGGIHKADLFLGCADSRCYVGATVKWQAKDQRAFPGVRIGISPAVGRLRAGVQRHPRQDLMLIAVPCEKDFIETFMTAERMVRALLKRRFTAVELLDVHDGDARVLAQQLIAWRHKAVLTVRDRLHEMASAEQLVVLGRARPADLGAPTYLHRLDMDRDVVFAPKLLVA